MNSRRPFLELSILEGMVMDAYQRVKNDVHRFVVWGGLMPGEPVAGQELSRVDLDGPPVSSNP